MQPTWRNLEAAQPLLESWRFIKDVREKIQVQVNRKQGPSILAWQLRFVARISCGQGGVGVDSGA